MLFVIFKSSIQLASHRKFFSVANVLIPYRRTDSTVARKMHIFMLYLSFDFHTGDPLTSKSLNIQEPRSLKSWTILRHTLHVVFPGWIGVSLSSSYWDASQPCQFQSHLWWQVLVLDLFYNQEDILYVINAGYYCWLVVSTSSQFES